MATKSLKPQGFLASSQVLPWWREGRELPIANDNPANSDPSFDLGQVVPFRERRSGNRAGSAASTAPQALPPGAPAMPPLEAQNRPAPPGSSDRHRLLLGLCLAVSLAAHAGLSL